ncbi:MAG: hypothetical protein K6E98_09825 [Lachnospiraceae bacterium]|nr:hypothetical protein [Lachnospiraceae bacterium]
MQKIRRSAIIIFGCVFVLSGCTMEKNGKDIKKSNEVSIYDTVYGYELFAAADNKEEAEELAKLYGIELREFSYGVATFHTKEDPREVIKRGKDRGWKELEINHSIELD